MPKTISKRLNQIKRTEIQAQYIYIIPKEFFSINIKYSISKMSFFEEFCGRIKNKENKSKKAEKCVRKAFEDYIFLSLRLFIKSIADFFF